MSQREGGRVAAGATLREGTTVGEVRRDRAAFEDALDRWYPATVRFARLLIHDQNTVEETVRGVWQNLVTRLDQFDSSDDLAFMALRKTVEEAVARLEVTAERQAVDSERFEPEPSRWAGWWSTTPRALMQDGVNQRLEHALSTLPPAVAAVVALRDIEGLSPTETESVLGFPPDAQHALLHSARIAAWQALAAPEPES